MDLPMSHVEEHEFVLGETTFTITTGKVDNGWLWACDGFPNHAGVKPSRELAVEAAIKEIEARGGLVL